MRWPSGDQDRCQSLVVVCELGLVFSVGIHDIDSPVSVAVGGECDALAVGRPNRMPVHQYRSVSWVRFFPSASMT